MSTVPVREQAVDWAGSEVGARTPPPLSASLNAVLADFARLPGAAPIAALDGARLLVERMLRTGAKWRNGCSPNGDCRLVRTADGTLAVNLPRPSDWELLAAWLAADADGAWSWPRLTEAVRSRATGPLIERARLLALAVAATGNAFNGCAQSSIGHPSMEHPSLVVDGDPLGDCRNLRPRPRPPVVVDLSALWAGPLCGHLLWLCGGRVVKVESMDRLDGARFGDADFYTLLNQGKRSLTLDLGARDERSLLLHLVEQADIVIESSRPRALRQLGIQAEEWVRRQTGRTWISITGYGRVGAGADWIAFGDDAGVAAGLADLMRAATGAHQFAGDAIADPLTGVAAAQAAWRSWLRGGSRLISLSLTGVAACTLAKEIDELGSGALIESARRWWQAARLGRSAAGLDRRAPTAPASEPGADRAAVLRELSLPC
ncbi:MAG: CoA transferase [Gammaproteobacteria bacterium]|nr:CoA transferase [Gammaproteobacteria bacterium]